MLPTIPPPILHADAVHHGIMQRVSFSQHINPTNAIEARLAFLHGDPAPPFEYIPLQEADDLLKELDAAWPPTDHPAGVLIARLFQSTQLLIQALRDRTADRFDAMARAEQWYPDARLLALRFPEDTLDEQPLTVNARRIIARLNEALRQRELNDWVVLEDPVMAARVLVDGAKRVLRVNPYSRFRERDVERLVVHEIDIHATRARNGSQQPLRCFETGLPGALTTEEGLAMVAEERAHVSSPSVLTRQTHVAWAIDRGRHLGFRELYDALVERVGTSLAWGICLRIKRGLAHPDLPGVYAKDTAYLRGRELVRRWLEDGGDPVHMFVGKVGVSDPVGEWLDQGWIRPQPVPASWSS